MKLKPLTWVVGLDNDSKSKPIKYLISDFEIDDVKTYLAYDFCNKKVGQYKTIGKAKKACQKDYENVIGSCIEEEPNN